MKIQVTKKHIEKGKAKDCERCPIALAILEQVPNCVSVDVTELDICGCLNCGTAFDITIPRKASDFVVAFDNYRNVKPFEFELELNQ